MKSNRAIVFPAWGAEWIDRVGSCIRESQLPPYPIFLMTDAATDVSSLPAGIEVVRRDSQLSGKAKKTGTDASAARRLGKKFAAKFGTEPPPGKTWTDVASELQSI